MEAHGNTRGVSATVRSTTFILAAGLLLGLITMLSGCAATTPENFVEEPGVTVRVVLTSGDSFSGTLIGMDDGVLIVDRSVPKSSDVTVVRSDGVDIVYRDDTPIGSAVEIRGVDILVRERLAFFEIDDIRVVSKAYFGWGTAIAAVLAFLLVRVLQDM
ncbi:MAG: hypothetical protein U9Q95_00305 [Candidatus Eisenbacteria bacterium]|nr:hypothetical protein [Candidatus Eisenbacteria bacterium]